MGLATQQQSAGDVIHYLDEGVERLLCEHFAWLLEGHEVSPGQKDA